MDLGAVVIVVLLVVAMPVAVLMGMAALAGLLGGLIGRASDLDNLSDDGEPNEYLALSRTNPYRD